jgi:hypothetical protein
MSDEKIVLAIFSLAGAAIAALVSFFVAKYKVASETRRHREFFIEKLFDIRINIYPGFYNYLSLFAKKIEEQKIDNDELEEFLNHLSDWESKNSIFVSPLTEQILIQIRRVCRKYLKNGFSKSVLNKELKRKIYSLEMALKKELGVYELMEHHKPGKVLELRDEIERL